MLRVLAGFLILALAQPVAAQEHGNAPDSAVAESGESGEAAQLHRRFFADPRVYRLSDGRSLIFGPFRIPGSEAPTIKLLDSSTGELLPLTSSAMDRLFGPGGQSFVLTEHGARLEWRRPGFEALHAVLEPALENEEIEFRNGAIALAGRFTRSGPGRRPGLILSHGGGAADRNFFYYALIAGYFAERGFNVLTYDKRGTGRSSSANAPDLPIRDAGSDLSAAVRYLAARPDVDPERIGILGVSQGGWLAPLASDETGQVAYLALLSAPPVDTWEQEMNEARSDLAARNFDPEQTRAALEAMRVMYAAAEAGAPTPELAAAAAAARGQPWASVVEFSGSAAKIADLRATRYDPRPVIERLRVPNFLAYGEADLITPHQAYVPAWRSALERSGAEDVTINVYSGANHGLLRNPAAQGAGGGIMAFAPGFLGTLSQWMEVRAGLQPATSR